MDNKSQLLKQNRKLFRTTDLALVWGITNRNTLLTTISRYLKDETLYSVKKGLYTVVPPEEIDPYLLGTAYVNGFTYVSLQTVLEQNGMINQSVQSITLVGSRSEEFTLGGHSYICKKMNEKYLNNLEGITIDQEYPIATIERAIADILYFNPKYHFDSPIEKYSKKVKLIQKEVFS